MLLRVGAMIASVPNTKPARLDAAVAALRSEASLHHPRIREAVALVDARRFGDAIKMLQQFRKRHPRNAEAPYLLAEIARRQGRRGDVESLLIECLAVAPEFNLARYAYAIMLIETHRPGAALAEAQKLTSQSPRNPVFLQLKAKALEDLEEYDAAVEVWHELVETEPGRLDSWTHYAYLLRGLGAFDDSVAAYRRAIAILPSFGSAWWGLADLKTFQFGELDVEQMEQQLARTDLDGERPYFHFALGKAYGDLGAYEKSFNHYARGNALHQLGRAYDPGALTAHVARCKNIFTADYFRERADTGCASNDPIFIVGMPRAGSTLVEQILASHSGIEGTTELLTVGAISAILKGGRDGDYLTHLARLDASRLRTLGEQYLEAARPHRKHGKPRFTDKMGGNFLHLGLLRLILPNARIVDVRRHPLACGISNFMQMFVDEKRNASRLADIGRNYRDYVELMAHFDRVQPGKVLRVHYEDLILDPETQIRRLLDHLGVRFEPSCLSFHETARVLTTASSVQVKKPLYRDALEHWRHYEPWLGPLKSALGPVLDAYPSVPAFD